MAKRSTVRPTARRRSVAQNRAAQRSVELRLDYPRRSSRLLNGLYLKGLFAIPHYLVLGTWAIGLSVTSLVAWAAIIVTGRYPRSLWEFGAGYWRYMISITAYIMMMTDEYPRFPWQ